MGRFLAEVRDFGGSWEAQMLGGVNSAIVISPWEPLWMTALCGAIAIAMLTLVSWAWIARWIERRGERRS